MSKNKLSFLAALVFSLLIANGVSSQTIIYSEDFNSGNGGATTVTVNTPDPGDQGNWTYSSSIGVGGSGAWFTAGGTTQGYPTPIPFEQQLILPTQTLTSDGTISLTFDHRYDFERDATHDWDGGMLMVNINNTGWNQVTDFSQNGYTGTIQTEYDWGYSGDFNGLDVWTGNSSGYVTTIASLGFLNSGDTIDVMFRGGWDWYAKGGNPNWALDNVVLAAMPEPKTYALILGLMSFVLIYFKKRMKPASVEE